MTKPQPHDLLLREIARDWELASTPSAWAEAKLGLVCDNWQRQVLDTEAKRLLLNCS
jgi:hypothetical protein